MNLKLPYGCSMDFRYIVPTIFIQAIFICFELENIKGLENLDTSQVTNMSFMFSNCHKLTSLNLSSFNTSNVTDMGTMFGYSYNLKTVE